MGLAGLALAWHSAEAALGSSATGVSLVFGVVAVLMFVALLGLSVLRFNRFQAALAEDLRHPVRHAFVAALPVATLLLVTLGVALAGTHPVLDALWWLAALGQLWATVWVLKRWLVATPVSPAPQSSTPAALQGLIQGASLSPAKPAAPAPSAPAFWPTVTPVLFIPVVGNVLVPLAGVPLGLPNWSAAQFGIGLLFWPVVLTLLAVRIGVQGLWPQRLLPTTFITVAPPAVVGLSALQLGAPVLLAWLAWGCALFFLLWSATVLRRMLSQPFGVPFWGVSFPLAAFAALTLRLADNRVHELAALAMLALATLVILTLSLATLKGLRSGELLAPEPVAVLTPAADAGTPAAPN